MKQRPARRAVWFWICLTWTGVLACDGSSSAAPEEVRSIAELPNVQVLFEGIAPLNAAVYRTDSILGGIVIGRITLEGRRGDDVGLQLEIPDFVLAAVGSNARVRVVGPDRSESFTLLQLSQGMIVYRLARGGQTRLTVELDRSVEGVREGAVRLLLRTGATIRSAELPWQRGTVPRKPASLSVQTSCTLQIGSGSCGNMTYTVVPSTSTTLPPGYLEIGGTFQSTAGNGPSSTIRLTFSLPIQSITTTIHDPTWAGNRMTGFDQSTSQQVSVDFVGNGTPGTTTTDTTTLTGKFNSIDLIPAANDYVSYDAEVVLAPPDTIKINCTPASIERASTQVTCTASSSGGTPVITQWKFKPSDTSIRDTTVNQNINPWQGLAVTSGDVTVTGTVGGTSAPSDTGRFTVTARPGWSWSADSSTGDATSGTFECNTARHYATGLFGWARATCQTPVLMVWPDPTGYYSTRGYAIAKVPSGPNAGLWYATSDSTGMRIRVQVLKDLRPAPDGFKYSVSGQDTVAKRCKAAGQNGQQTVTVVNNTCMTDPYQYNFAAMYAFIWRHERCHLMQFRNVFGTIPDPRTKLETIVKSDTASFHDEAFFEPGGYQEANVAILQANTIDPPNSSPEYKFWSRNAGNNAWELRSVTFDGILAAGC